MKEKLFVLKLILVTVLSIMILWDAVLLVTRQHITEQHKQVLFTTFLCWFVTIMSYRSRDDDWAGQY